MQLLPWGSPLDSYLSSKLAKMKAARLRIFFNELGKGHIDLTQDMIDSDEFLHAYFSTVDYVLRTNGEKKIKRFAIILKAVASKSISITDFEDYQSILNELSDKEFAMLSLKYEYEGRFLPEPGQKAFTSNWVELNELQVANLYWADFKNEVTEKLGIESSDFGPLLFRLQRTGCYLIFTGYMDGSKSHAGITTPLFHKIYKIVAEQANDN